MMIEKKKATIHTESDPCLINLKDKNHLIRYGHEILDQTRSRIVLKDDGTLVITPHFRQFPTEIVSLIVQCSSNQQALYQYTLVNKQFYTEANPLLWKSPKIQNEGALDLFSSSLSYTQSQMGRCIRKLHLSGEYWSDIYFSILMPHLRLLEEIKIDDTTSITDACLRHLPRHCHRLTSLCLIQRPISQLVSNALGQHCHQLSQLELELGNDDASPNILEALDPCPLQSISINFSGQADSASEEIMVALLRFRLLTRLEFNKVGATATKQLFLIKRSTGIPSWPHLTSLSLSKCRLIDDADLIPFIRSHPCLAEIHLGRDSQCTDDSLYAMSIHLSNLTSVFLAYNQRISPDGVHRLIRNCSHLESLTFRVCSCLSPSDFPEAPGQWNETGRVLKLHKEQIDRIRLAQW